MVSLSAKALFVLLDADKEEKPLTASFRAMACLQLLCVAAYAAMVGIVGLVATGAAGTLGCAEVNVQYPRMVDLAVGSYRLWRYVLLGWAVFCLFL